MPDKRDQPAPRKRKSTIRKRRQKFDPGDPHWIPHIHEYCDRWCERCEFSHRCFRFAATEQLLGNTKRRPPSNTSVLDALTRIVAEARQDLALIDRRDRKPIDDRRVTAQVAAEKRIQRKALTTGRRETKAAHTYVRIVDEWFNNEIHLALAHVRSLETRVQKGLIGVAEAKGDLVRMNESVEIIRWHQHIPYVKLCRAFTSRLEEDTAGEPLTQRDSDGSAKVALLSLDQSIEAWTQLRELLPEKTDSILEVLLRLDRLRRAISKRFPRARRFKRPGFDEKRKRSNAREKSLKKSGAKPRKKTE